jgi:hypothetical protein
MAEANRGARIKNSQTHFELHKSNSADIGGVAAFLASI